MLVSPIGLPLNPFLMLVSPIELLPLPVLYTWTKDAAIITFGLYLLDSPKPPLWVRLILFLGLLLLGTEMLIMDAEAPFTAQLHSSGYGPLLSISALLCFVCVGFVSTLNLLMRPALLGLASATAYFSARRESRRPHQVTKLT